MLKLNYPYKIIVDTTKQFQGYLDRGNGHYFAQGYLGRVIYLIDIENQLLLDESHYSRVHSKTDPYTFSVNFNVEIPIFNEHTNPAIIKVPIDNMQVFKLINYLNKEVFVKFIMKENKVFPEYRVDFYYPLYIYHLTYFDFPTNKVMPSSEGVKQHILMLCGK